MYANESYFYKSECIHLRAREGALVFMEGRE